jgi:hypothetical protein
LENDAREFNAGTARNDSVPGKPDFLTKLGSTEGEMLKTIASHNSYFKDLASAVSAKIGKQCPDIT